MTNPHMTSISSRTRRLAVMALALGLFRAPVMLSQAAATPKPAAKPAAAAVPPLGARAFPTAQAAATALIQAASNFDQPAIEAMFGPDGKELVTTEDPVRDKSYALAFASLAEAGHTVVVSSTNPSRATLQVGRERWPLPVPLVKVAGHWYFDAKSGRNEIVFRRIGGNELDAIEVCRGFVEAQTDYALDLHDDSRLHQYAQRLISTPGKQDGLYWKNPDSSDGGPIGETVARAINEGYAVDKASAYHGYLFQVLKAQGPAAPLGELDYVIGDAMIGGFALIATPADTASPACRPSSSITTASCIRRISGRTRWPSPGRLPATTPTRRGPAPTTRGPNERGSPSPPSYASCAIASVNGSSPVGAPSLFRRPPSTQGASSDALPRCFGRPGWLDACGHPCGADVSAKALADLPDKRIAIVEGYSYGEAADRAVGAARRLHAVHPAG